MRVTGITLLTVSMLVLSTANAADFPGAGRLKFKDGPVCMCNKGLNEADIRAGEARWVVPGGVKRLNGSNQTSKKPKSERRSNEQQ